MEPLCLAQLAVEMPALAQALPAEQLALAASTAENLSEGVAAAGQVAAHIFVDYIAVLVGVVYGALFAIERKLDIVGTVSLGLVTGYGGGIIRDILLQDQGFFFMQRPNVILASIIISMLLFFLRHRLPEIESHLFYIDAASMAIYALAGCVKTWEAGAGYILVVILGSITAVGGGAVRNICVGEVPRIFKAGNYYSVSAILGCAAYVVLRILNVPEPIPDVVCVVLAFVLTVLSAKLGWQTKADPE